MSNPFNHKTFNIFSNITSQLILVHTSLSIVSNLLKSCPPIIKANNCYSFNYLSYSTQKLKYGKTYYFFLALQLDCVA